MWRTEQYDRYLRSCKLNSIWIRPLKQISRSEHDQVPEISVGPWSGNRIDPTDCQHWFWGQSSFASCSKLSKVDSIESIIAVKYHKCFTSQLEYYSWRSQRPGGVGLDFRLLYSLKNVPSQQLCQPPCYLDYQKVTLTTIDRMCSTMNLNKI